MKLIFASGLPVTTSYAVLSAASMTPPVAPKITAAPVDSPTPPVLPTPVVPPKALDPPDPTTLASAAPAELAPPAPSVGAVVPPLPTEPLASPAPFEVEQARANAKAKCTQVRFKGTPEVAKSAASQPRIPCSHQPRGDPVPATDAHQVVNLGRVRVSPIRRRNRRWNHPRNRR